MGDLFNAAAVRAIGYANQSACDWGYEYIQPEHLLLGLVREGSILELPELHDVRQKKDKLAATIARDWVASGNTGTLAELPMNQAARRAIVLAVEHGHTPDKQAGAEHLMLGLLLLPDSALGHAFNEIGVDPAELLKRFCAAYSNPNAMTDHETR